MAREDRRYGKEAVDKKNDSQKRKSKDQSKDRGHLDKRIEDYVIEEIRHGQGKGENKERYEKRDNDKIQEKRRDEYSERLLDIEKHSNKF
jgi:hypothetical protein